MSLRWRSPTSDSEIRFEVWMPATSWNGKYEQVGNGGFAGTIPLSSMSEPLLRGYATAGTDDGHSSGVDPGWMIGHPEKVIDFGYRAVHETSVAAKNIVEAFYGKKLARSYFVGCSDGGREALMEAQRYPDDFVGIVAGDPANNWTRLQAGGVWNERALKDEPGSEVPPAKLPALQNAALAACDAMDGVKDGIIANPRPCHFDPGVIQCKDGDGPELPHRAAGGGGAQDLLWSEEPAHRRRRFSRAFRRAPKRFRRTGASGLQGTLRAHRSSESLIGNTFFAYMVFQDPKWDYRTFDFDKDMKTADDKIGPVINSIDPDLSKFKARERQADSVSRLGRRGDSFAEQRRLFRKRAVGDGQNQPAARSGRDGGFLPAVHGAGDVPLRRRRRRDILRQRADRVTRSRARRGERARPLG